MHSKIDKSITAAAEHGANMNLCRRTQILEDYSPPFFITQMNNFLICVFGLQTC